MIVATAGHVDHGKTSLIKALTGTDTDRLAEEKRRGLTIDLGFAYLPLGRDDAPALPIGFIDVPGHEKFIRNMVCGVAGIDLALFVIAADDGLMPQTREHLAVLDLLGIDRGLVALTKIDRVSPDRLTALHDEITGLLAPTTLAGSPVLPVSSTTGDGIDALRGALVDCAAECPPRPANGNFRLAVDRRFDVTGAGLVVTGTAFAGSCRVGDKVRIQGRDETCRVRAIRAQSEVSDTAAAGQRVALNLTGAGLTRDHVVRGDWIVTGNVPPPLERIDTRLRILSDETHAFAHWTPVHVHLAAGETTGRVAILGPKSVRPGSECLAQLVLDAPLGAAAGDRFIIRDQSARRTIGGGRVIDIFPPRRGRARPARLSELEALDTPDHHDAFAALSAIRPAGVDVATFAASRNLTDEEMAALQQAFDGRLVPTEAHPRAFSRAAWKEVCDRTVRALDEWHHARPDEVGPGPERLLTASGLNALKPIAGPIAAALEHDGILVRERLGLRRPGHRPSLAGPDQALWREVAAAMHSAGNRPATLADIAAATGQNQRRIESLLVTAGRHGLAHRISKTRYLTAEMFENLASIARDLAARSRDGTFDAKAFRDASSIGRNMTIEVLEYFDKQGLTIRRGDIRVLKAGD